MSVRGRAEVDAPPPAILMSAFKPAMLRFAGEEADGVVTWMVGRRPANFVIPQVTACQRRCVRRRGLPPPLRPCDGRQGEGDRFRPGTAGSVDRWHRTARCWIAKCCGLTTC